MSSNILEEITSYVDREVKDPDAEERIRELLEVDPELRKEYQIQSSVKNLLRERFSEGNTPPKLREEILSLTSRKEEKRASLLEESSIFFSKNLRYAFITSFVVLLLIPLLAHKKIFPNSSFVEIAELHTPFTDEAALEFEKILESATTKSQSFAREALTPAKDSDLMISDIYLISRTEKKESQKLFIRTVPMIISISQLFLQSYSSKEKPFSPKN